MVDGENIEQIIEIFEIKRVRIFIVFVQEEYERRVIKFMIDFWSIKNDLDVGVVYVDEVRNDLDFLKLVREFIQSCEIVYREFFGKFVDFLRVIRIYDSENEEVLYYVIFRIVFCKVDLIM